MYINPVCTGGADLPDLSRIPKFPYFALQTHAEIGWLFMYVHYSPFRKKLASYVPWFNFDGIFFDKKSGFQIANFLFFSKIAKTVFVFPTSIANSIYIHLFLIQYQKNSKYINKISYYNNKYMFILWHNYLTLCTKRFLWYFCIIYLE